MVPKPTVSLHGSGESIFLSNRAGRYVLMQGANGLGWGAQELSTAPLASGGSVLLHKRVGEAEVMIPMLLGGDYDERFEDRRMLERLCQGEVEVRVTQPSGESRSRFGHLRDGLEGSYESGEDSPDGQKLVLTFLCPDSFWYGGQRSERWGLSPDRRQWLSDMEGDETVPQLVRTNYVLNPSSEGPGGRVQLVGGAYQESSSNASSEQSRYGSMSWRLEALSEDGHQIGGYLETSASANMRYGAGVWVRPGEGVKRVTVTVERHTGTTWAVSASEAVTDLAEGEWSQVTVAESSAAVGDRRLVVKLFGGASALQRTPIPEGSVTYIDGAVLTDAESPLDFFDGNTPIGGYTADWTGAANGSASRLWTIPASGSGIMGVPFGHMQLSQSTVQGATAVDVAGDADAEAVVVVTGPGEDLEVVNESTGQRVFIGSEIDEPITIDARRRVQDVYSESRQDGEWWEFINDDAPLELITLRPGQNRIRVTMVNAHPKSSVELLYRETYHAGH